MNSEPKGAQNRAKSESQQNDPNQAKSSFIQSSDDSPNIVLGAAAGAVTSAVCAAIWAAITFFTNYQLGLMAIGLGCAVGLSIRKFGRGNSKLFGVIGAAEALLGCLAGNLLTVCLVVSKQQGVPLLEVMGRLTPDLIVDLMGKTFDAMDLLFYGFAIYEAFKLAVMPNPKIVSPVAEKTT